MYPSSTCMCVNLISRSYRTSFSTSNATGGMQCNVNSSCSEILLPTVILFPLCLFCIWSCKCSCIRSAQSRNLCNLKIALHNLRIRKLCANLKFAIHLCNLKMVQYICAISRWCNTFVQSQDGAIHLRILRGLGLSAPRP